MAGLALLVAGFLHAVPVAVVVDIPRAVVEKPLYTVLMEDVLVSGACPDIY